MNLTDVSAVPGLASTSFVPREGPRSVDAAISQQFRELMGTSDCGRAVGPCKDQPKVDNTLSMDIEKVLMANLPPSNASPAEFAMGMLRAQVKVSQAAIAIEMVSKTTQSLSQGVQSLTTRS
jgi:hypothetical protein